MCVKSQQVTLWELLADPTPLSVDFPASLGASQANNAEQTTRATCGPSTTVLSATCAHGGSSARTCPVCCLQVPTQSSPIWKQRATPAGRSYWVPTTSARRTDAGEFSLSRDWPTPTLDCATERANRYAQGGLPLTTAVQMWPTPQAGKAPNDINLRCSGDGRTVPNKLGWAVAEQMWPTPQARDWKDGATQGNRKSPNLGPTVCGQHDQANPNTRGRSRARLNPRWVAQLMGFPADWLDGVQVPSAGSATR